MTGLKAIIEIKFMHGMYEIVRLSTTRGDVSFTFERYNGYTRLNKRHKYKHNVYYLGMLKETNNHVHNKGYLKLVYISVFATLIMYIIDAKNY